MKLLCAIYFTAVGASAQYLVDSLSFGHKDTYVVAIMHKLQYMLTITSVSPNSNGIPNWRLLPENQQPQIV